MYKIKFYGIGGQGVVIATNLLCIAACLYDDKYGRTQPSFGHERRGAPVISHLYIDDHPIQISSFIYCPDIVVLFDPYIIEKGIDITEGIHNDTSLVINSNSKETIYNKSFKEIHILDATKLSLQYMKNYIPNISMLGAIARLGIVHISSIIKTLQNNFNDETKALNIELLKNSYEKTKRL